MSFEFNNGQFSGNLTRDAEVRTTKTGTPMVTFTVANNRTSQGNKRTTFIRCVWYGDLAAKLSEFLVKGKPVFVTGAVELDEYEKDGTKYTNLQLVVRDLQLLYSDRIDGERGANTERDLVAAGDIDTEDVPF